MGAHYSKRKEIKLVWPAWRSTNCVSLKRTFKAGDMAVVDKSLLLLVSGSTWIMFFTIYNDKYASLQHDDFQRGWKMEGKDEVEMREGRRNAHPVIPWFARRQALYSAFQCKHNKHSIEELTSHVKPLPVWLKGKKEGLYLLMIGWRTKLILCSIGRTSLCRFFLSHIRIKCQCLTQCLDERIPRLIQEEVSEPKKSQYHIHRCTQPFRKHADRKCANTHKTLWTQSFYHTSSI